MGTPIVTFAVTNVTCILPSFKKVGVVVDRRSVSDTPVGFVTTSQLEGRPR